MKNSNKENSAAASAPTNGFSLISDQKLLDIYTTMVKCRLLAERTPARFDAAAGHEAALVGVLIDLQPEDAIGPSRSDLLVNFIKGAPLDRILGQRFARSGSSSNGRKALDLSSVIAAQLAAAIDAASANKTSGNGKVVVALAGDRSTPIKVWHEAWNSAGIQDLPIVFVCQNYPSSKPRNEVEDLAARAQTYRFPGIAVDGNDVVAVYRVASEAIAKARAGSGPTFIECKAFRRAGATGKAQDPIRNMENYLAGKGLHKAQRKREVAAQFGSELDTAMRAAKLSPVSERNDASHGFDSLLVRERVLNPTIWAPKS